MWLVLVLGFVPSMSLNNWKGKHCGYSLEAVLTCTHDLCFKLIYNFSSENNDFYSREILQYILFGRVIIMHNLYRCLSK